MHTIVLIVNIDDIFPSFDACSTIYAKVGPCSPVPLFDEVTASVSKELSIFLLTFADIFDPMTE